MSIPATQAHTGTGARTEQIPHRETARLVREGWWGTRGTFIGWSSSSSSLMGPVALMTLPSCEAICWLQTAAQHKERGRTSVATC